MSAQTDVIVIGGGLNGLTTAVLLANRGLRCVVVERHPKTSIQYKFAGISPRSMEIFRSVGLEEEIRRNRTGDQKLGAIVRMKNLLDRDINWGGNAWPDTSDISPVTAETCDQERLEPILKEYAGRLGADIRFNTEAVSLEQDEEEVRVRIVERSTHQESVVTASYVVAADGDGGRTREWVGIERHGPGVLQHWLNVIFETDLQPQLDGRQVTSFFLTDINGTFVPRQSGRWLMAIQYFPERGEPTSEQCVELIRKGAGRSDVKADIVDIRPWEVAAYIADRYREGRVFLLGDTAHLMPPTGAFGGNTGIHDAHNIAWKLDAVLHGAATAKLLNTYDSERRPVAERSLEQSLSRLQAWFKDRSKHLSPAKPQVDDYAVVFGYLYREGAVVDASLPREKQFENPRELSGEPGSRAPHVMLMRNDRWMSSLDLFGRGFVLLTGTDGQAWLAAAARIDMKGFPFDYFQIGVNEGASIERFGIRRDGAILVRPDGFVAWRSRSRVADPKSVLADVFEQLQFPPDGDRGRSQSQSQSTSVSLGELP